MGVYVCAAAAAGHSPADRAQKRIGVNVGAPAFPAVDGFDGNHAGARTVPYSADGSMLAAALEGRCVARAQRRTD